MQITKTIAKKRKSKLQIIQKENKEVKIKLKGKWNKLKEKENKMK